MISRALVAAAAVTTTATCIYGYNHWKSNRVEDVTETLEGKKTDLAQESRIVVTKVPGKNILRSSSLEECIDKARAHIQCTMVEQGVPGCSVAVMKDGKCVWSEGLGYADVENDVPCSPNSVMRIASISKSLTAVALMQLYEEGKVDLDAPVQDYVPDFPEKTYEGEKVKVTTRHLMSHLAGIRHYRDKESGKTDKKIRQSGEFSLDEYYIKSHYKSVKDSLKLFSDDDLVSRPGSEYHYSTFGWSLIEAVIENVSGVPYLKYMKTHVMDPLGMTSTVPEFHEQIVRGRARHYYRKDSGSLSNTPYVDLSYKWAGGGFLSNSEDLVKFGNAVLSCWHRAAGSSRSFKPPDDHFLLQPSTTKLMLTRVVENTAAKSSAEVTPPATPTPPIASPVQSLSIPTSSTPPPLPPQSPAPPPSNSPSPAPPSSAPPIGYGLGWYVRPSKKGVVGGRNYPMAFGHTGGAVGACSVLTVLPGEPEDDLHKQEGVVVAVIFNLQEVKGVFHLGLKVAEEFLAAES